MVTTDNELELTIRVEELDEGSGDPKADTIEAVKACLNGNRSSAFFADYEVRDAEYVPEDERMRR